MEKLMQPFQEQFIQYALDCEVLRFGSFTLKSGRQSPYFFNTGLFDSGQKIASLGRFYAAAMQHYRITPDVLYGPAYKGIPLAVTTAVALADQHAQDLPFCFNRKEAKDHGEGGHLVGAPLKGSVLILDDVISAGTSVRESIAIIEAAGATPAGVLIALDRQEKGAGELSAIEEVSQRYALPVYSIITLQHIMAFMQDREEYRSSLQSIRHYLAEYGSNR